MAEKNYPIKVFYSIFFTPPRWADAAFVWRRPARMRGQPAKPHTAARRALPLVRVSYPLRLLFNAVDVPLHDDCRLRDFLALLELPALLPDLLIDLRKLFIEIRFSASKASRGMPQVSRTSFASSYSAFLGSNPAKAASAARAS